MTQETIPLPTYFKSLTVENVKCFSGSHAPALIVIHKFLSS